MSDIGPGDEVVIRGTGEHGTVQEVVCEPQVYVAIGGTVVQLDLGAVMLAGEEAP
jgi:preprotein translocase subunit YajC